MIKKEEALKALKILKANSIVYDDNTDLGASLLESVLFVDKYINQQPNLYELRDDIISDISKLDESHEVIFRKRCTSGYLIEIQNEILAKTNGDNDIIIPNGLPLKLAHKITTYFMLLEELKK